MIVIKALKSAIIGCGNIHGLHAEGIIGSNVASLEMVADIDTERAKKASLKYGCRYTTNYKDILNDDTIDVVHICTPHYLHAPMSIEAMRAGKHVFVEKPMAISVADAREMIEVSEQTGKKLGVCFQNRYNYTTEKILQLIRSGSVGAVKGARAFVTWNRDEKYYASGAWRGTWKEEGGGVLINQAIHTLDLVQFFLGDAVSVKGSYSTRLLEGIIEVEDTADATIRFASGANAIFFATNCHVTNSPVMIEIMCENAVLRLEGSLTVTYKNGETEKYEEIDKATGEKAYWGKGHVLIIKDFYESILNGNAVRVDGNEGIKAIKIINGIYESARIGKFVSLV